MLVKISRERTLYFCNWIYENRKKISSVIKRPRFHVFYHDATAPSGPGPPRCRGFTITLRHNTLGRTPLDEWSARRRDLYLTTQNTHKRQTSMPPAGFEFTIPASERPQTHAWDRAATGIGPRFHYCHIFQDNSTSSEKEGSIIERSAVLE
jgi:hypothetical protein